MARGLKFQIKEAEGLHYLYVPVVKTKVLTSFAFTVKLMYAFIIAYAKSRFSHDGAHL